MKRKRPETEAEIDTLNTKPSGDAEGIDEVLHTWLKTPEGTDWAKQSIKEAKNPAIARNRKHNEARHEAFFSFLRYLDELPADHSLPKGFQTRWKKWLRRFEEDEIAKLPPKDRTEDRVGKWVKRAWVTTELNDSGELETGRFIYHDDQPNAEKHPIPVILIHQKGQWRMPTEQTLAATARPTVRAFCQTLPTLPDKAAVLGKMRWAHHTTRSHRKVDG